MDAFAHALARYSVQILLIVSAAACTLLVIRARAPRFRLAAWRAVLFVCLLLPLVPPRVVHVQPAPEAAVAVALLQPATTAAPDKWRPGSILVWLVIAGAMTRTLWLGVGLLRLRSLRAEGVAATLADDHADLQRTLAPSADIRWHDRLTQPVTFGLVTPVVLLPSRLRTLPADLQRAVLCHELLHARRGDWRATIFEEVVRTVLWFHPAMWWLIGQIQLCREETVDALAVSMTSSRRVYMQALLAFAQPPATPLLAPLFVHRRHLVLRIRQLSREVVMSRTRVVLSAAGLMSILVASGWTVASALPVRTAVLTLTPSPAPSPAPSPGPAQSIAPPSQPAVRAAPPPPPPQPPPPPADGKTNPRVISETKPAYPAEALPHGVTAHVWVAVTIAADGQVADAKATRFQLTIDRSIDDPNYWASKPERPFMEASEAAALKWRFAPPDANTRTAVDLMFAFRNIKGLPGGAFVGSGVGGGTVFMGPGTPLLSPDQAPQTRIVEPHSQGQGVGVVSAGQPGPRVLRVGGAIAPPQKVVDVKPVYPIAAQVQNVQGVVILELRIGVDGSVVDVHLLRSIPLLDDAALTAVRQWKFTPTLLNGEPVELILTTTVNFVM